MDSSTFYILISYIRLLIIHFITTASSVVCLLTIQLISTATFCVRLFVIQLALTASYSFVCNMPVIARSKSKEFQATSFLISTSEFTKTVSSDHSSPILLNNHSKRFYESPLMTDAHRTTSSIA
jgi:hypothetical protein